MKAKSKTITIHDARYHRLLGPGPTKKTVEEIAQDIIRRETAKLAARRGLTS